MAYTLKYIKNPPTAEDLINLYHGDLYQSILSAFRQQTRAKITDEFALQTIRQRLKRQYLILNIPMGTVLAEMEQHRAAFLSFCIAKHTFFKQSSEINTDDDLGEGYDFDDADKAEIQENHGMCQTFLLSNFCEFYLLKLGDKARFLHYLKTIRIPAAKKHASEMTQLYQTIHSK